MRMMTLNLASRPFRNNTVVGWALFGIATAILLASAYNLYFFLHYGTDDRLLQETQQRDRTALERAEAEEARLTREVQARDFRRLYDRSRFAGDLILKRSFSWTLLFNNLEGVMPPDVIMTAIRPNISSEVTVVRVDGVAKGAGAFITLQEKLLSNKAFARVYPISERKLNPNGQEITFALNFGYLQKAAAAPPEVVASNTGAAAGPSPGPAAAATTPAPVKGPEPPPPAQAAAAPAAPARPPTKGTVGRDGRPRTPALMALLIAAPGGVYVPPGAAPAGRLQEEAGLDRAGAGPAHSKGPRAGNASQPPAPPPAGGQRGAAGGGTGKPAPATPSPVLLPSAAPPQAGPAAPPGVVRRTPGETQGAGLRPRAARMQDLSRPLTTAVRLDVPMRFSGRPVKEIYGALARAHGVRFDLDPGVDPEEKVSADVAGRSLADAIAIVSRAAGHSVKRGADGSYKVAVSAGGEPISERPVGEESLPVAGVKP